MRNAVFVIGALMLTAPSSKPPLTGCYEVTRRSGWTGGTGREDPTRLFLVPTVFRLDSTHFKGPASRDTLFNAAPNPYGGASFTWPHWKLIGSDSVNVRWGNGFHGVTLELRITGDSLTGHAQGWTDVLDMEQPWLDIVAHKRECPKQLQ